MLLFKFISTKLLLITVLVIVIGTFQRIQLAKSLSYGGDVNTHIRAVTDLLSGKNPYTWTVQSYQDLENDPGNKGYAYFPGIMYINAVLYLFHLLLRFNFNINISLPFIMQFPSIVASLFVGLFFIKFFYKRDNWAMLFCTSFWFFSPYIYSRHADIGYDAIPIACLLWAFYFLEKNTVVSGVLYSLSVIFKTFPIIMIFIFLLKSKNKFKFIIAGLVVVLLFSLPFLRSVEDFYTYVQGALLVHGDRFVQGRPYLYYLSYYYHIELFRIIPFKVYSISAIISGWIATLILFFSKITDKYKLSIFPIILFSILTPVLNRTYLMWGVPLLLVGSYNFFEKKHKWLFYVINSLYWIFAYWYLVQWKDGFHIWHPI